MKDSDKKQAINEILLLSAHVDSIDLMLCRSQLMIVSDRLRSGIEKLKNSSKGSAKDYLTATEESKKSVDDSIIMFRLITTRMEALQLRNIELERTNTILAVELKDSKEKHSRLLKDIDLFKKY